MDDFVTELVGYVESEGTVSVINLPLLFITQDAVGVIDLLELKGKNDDTEIVKEHLLKEIGTRTIIASGNKRARANLFQNISMAMPKPAS